MKVTPHPNPGQGWTGFERNSTTNSLFYFDISHG